jgi:hypothetical protein
MHGVSVGSKICMIDTEVLDEAVAFDARTRS